VTLSSDGEIEEGGSLTVEAGVKIVVNGTVDVYGDLIIDVDADTGFGSSGAVNFYAGSKFVIQFYDEEEGELVRYPLIGEDITIDDPDEDGYCIVVTGNAYGVNKFTLKGNALVAGSMEADEEALGDGLYGALDDEGYRFGYVAFAPQFPFVVDEHSVLTIGDGTDTTLWLFEGAGLVNNGTILIEEGSGLAFFNADVSGSGDILDTDEEEGIDSVDVVVGDDTVTLYTWES